MSDRRRGLGKGLGALIPPASGLADRPTDVFFPRGVTPPVEGFTGNTAAEASSDPGSGEDSPPAADGTSRLRPVPGVSFGEIPVGEIVANPRQPRQVFDEDELAELVHSITEVGVLQPIVVRAVSPAASDSAPAYELVMGERRWRASVAAGRETVPAIIRQTVDDDLLRDALLENLHRSELNALEEAAAYQQLLDDFGCTHEELARRIGRSRPQISNTIRLLKLPPLVQRRVASGVLSAGHARALLGLGEVAAMERLAQRIVAEGLSVRSVEEIVLLGDTDTAPRARAPRPSVEDPALANLSRRLSDRLDTRVQVVMGRRKGKLTVEFGSREDLARILELLALDEDGQPR